MRITLRIFSTMSTASTGLDILHGIGSKRYWKNPLIINIDKLKKLPKDKKSIALRVLLQPQEKTFTDEEIENISNQIIDLVTNGFEATLRQ